MRLGDCNDNVEVVTKTELQELIAKVNALAADNSRLLAVEGEATAIVEKTRDAIRHANTIEELKVSIEKESADYGKLLSDGKALEAQLKEMLQLAQKGNDELKQRLKEVGAAEKERVALLSEHEAKVKDALHKAELDANNLKTRSDAISAAQKKVDDELVAAQAKRQELLKLENEAKKTWLEFLGEKKNGAEIKGRKAELEDLFQQMKEKYASVSAHLDESQKNYDDRLQVISTNAENKIAGYQAKIEGMFAGALAVGLGEAYNIKRKEEEANAAKYSDHFFKALCVLLALGIAAVIADFIYAWCYKGDGPFAPFKFISFFVLPVVAPTIWYALVVSRKANLAKRLAEEYEHKEVVSKTYEGLSKQIESLGDEAAAKDLRIKLLDIAVSVNQKNAGELIEGYNRPDHPLLELIDKVGQANKEGQLDRFAKVISAFMGKKEDGTSGKTLK